MNKNFTNNKFTGKINGKTSHDYYYKAKLCRCSTIEEQIKSISDILGVYEINGRQFVDEFWTKVFLQNDEDEYCGGIKLTLNKTDNLYSDSNVCAVLERMASDILKKDKKKDNDMYMKVYTSISLFKKAKDEQEELLALVENTPDGKYALDNNLDDYFVLANQMNYKMEKKIKNIDDLALKKLNDEYGSKYSQVNDYYNGYKTMKNTYVNFTQYPRDVWEKYPKELRKKYRYKKMVTVEDNQRKDMLSRNVYSLRDDFINCINYKSRPIVFKAPLPDKGEPNWDMYDPTDPKHIYAALQVPKSNDMSNELAVITTDLDNTINECEFTEMQKEVLKLHRKDKTQEDIGNILGISKQVVNKHIISISNKIANKNMEKLEDWYYMNIQYGEYKKCSQCGEIKLVSRFDKNGKQGFMSMCKQCRK